MTRDLDLTLVGSVVPSGEIAAKDLVGLASALQELTTRIARDVVSTPGPGRSKQFVEEFVQLRLQAVHAGSTVLRFVKGPVGKLDVELPEEAIADERFWEVIESIADDHRPDWVTDLIAESAGKLVSAIHAAAPEVVLGTSTRKPIHVHTQATHVETWASGLLLAGNLKTVAGRLEKVDLRSHEFRVRDDVGHAVELRHVDNDAVAAQLVGQWVIAEGQAVNHASGRLVALESARVLPAADPAAEYLGPRVVAVDEILASAPGPDIGGGIDLTDEEFEAFLRAARS
ncbi:hypothetical protein [Mycobacterium sp. QGD 101]|uniref:hypothetical protein n=1 Tax=Mycobacterium hubeiense TaxID=1867256 RepID=UPI000C7EE43B